MKKLRKILFALKENPPDAVYVFIVFSSSLIFGIFAWRQRLLYVPASFTLNLFGLSLGSHIIYYLLSFVEIPSYSFFLIFLISRVSLWINQRCKIPFKDVFSSLSLNCLWFYLLPINFYLTNGFTQGYPNYLLGNSHNPYQFSPPAAFPLGFWGVAIWFGFFFFATAVVITRKITALSDERIFNYIAVLIGGFSLSLFLGFFIKGGGDLYFLWYFLVMAGVWFLYECLVFFITRSNNRAQREIRDRLALGFALLILLPFWYRCYASFYLNVWFYLALALAALAAVFYCLRCRSKGARLKFLILYFIVPLGIFILFFNPLPESTITPAHTANMYYFPYDSIYHGRVLIRDYPVISRGFLTDTGFIGFFKIFGFSVYKANIFLRFTEPFVLVLLYFLLLRILPWHFVFLCLILMRTHYIWLDFTVFTANWPTQIRAIYPDLLLLAFVVFLQERKRIFLFLTAAFLPLALLNSPDFGYSLILAVAVTVFVILIFEKKLSFNQAAQLESGEKLFLAIFAISLAAYWFILLCLLASVKLILPDYVFIGLFLGVCVMLFLGLTKGKNSKAGLDTPIGVIIWGLFICLAPFVYYLLRIKSLKAFFFLVSRIPFAQMSIKAIAEAHFNPLFTYAPPVFGKDIGYFMLWHFPPAVCLSSIMFAAYLVLIRKEAKRPLAYVLVFLCISSIMAYPRSMVLAEELKMIFSMHFVWLLFLVMSYHGIMFFKSKRILLYGLLLVNFIPTLPLFSSPTMRETNLMSNYNNFYITTLDAELKYLYNRNVDRDYLSRKFNGYFGNLQWFKDNEEDLYRSLWAEEGMRIARKSFGWEKQSAIDNTIWPRVGWRASFDVTFFQKLLGKTVTAGLWLKVEESRRVRIFISDREYGMVFSPYHSGNNKWEFLKVTAKINPRAKFVKVGMEIKPGVVIFREENGMEALRIGHFRVEEGDDLVAPDKIEDPMTMLTFLFRKVYNPELITY